MLVAEIGRALLFEPCNTCSLLQPIFHPIANLDVPSLDFWIFWMLRKPCAPSNFFFWYACFLLYHIVSWIFVQSMFTCMLWCCCDSYFDSREMCDHGIFNIISSSNPKYRRAFFLYSRDPQPPVYGAALVCGMPQIRPCKQAKPHPQDACST